MLTARDSLLALVGMAFVSLFPGQHALALTLSFDDIPTVGQELVPQGYGGFDWTNLYVLDTEGQVGNGYAAGRVSGGNVMFDAAGGPGSFHSSTTFTLEGFYLTAAWISGLSVSVTGRRNGVIVDETELTASTTAPAQVWLNWSGLDEVDLATAQESPFVIDNLLVSAVPEPEGFLLLGSALMALFCMARLRLRER